MSIASEINRLKSELPQGVNLVAVSKFHPAGAVMEAYNAGQRIFGESRPQEFAAKCKELPEDIQWHFIGHLQTNKLKLVLPYVSMVQSIDSLHLLEAVNAWAVKEGKKINILLELHLGAEETKQGFTGDEIEAVLANAGGYAGVCFRGLMGMATNTDDENIIRADFQRIASLRNHLREAHPELPEFTELSIGMSEDYRIALDFNPTYVRIGTAIFGPRVY
ncbi:MAG: YggS family pyridoxal phosphate-dependent enzyme [Candidatus Cryptobacteroides sp.]